MFILSSILGFAHVGIFGCGGGSSSRPKTRHNHGLRFPLRFFLACNLHHVKEISDPVVFLFWNTVQCFMKPWIACGPEHLLWSEAMRLPTATFTSCGHIFTVSPTLV